MNARTLIEALNLWEATGSDVAHVAREVSELLAHNGIPNLLAGGLAVQLHGYPRMTVGVDFIVPDVQKAHEFLLSKGYAPSCKRMLAVVDRNKKVTVDLLPAGQCLQRKCQVPFPVPTDASAVLLPVSLEELISLKLDS